MFNKVIILTVYRCEFPRWPDNGYIDCDGSDIIYGTTCTIRCKDGYTLDGESSYSLQCIKHGAWQPPRHPDCKRKLW